MQFTAGEFYHVYNRGNNKQPIFFNTDNYLYFLKKVRKQILPHSNILAYSLMPNHFHFLVRVKELLAQQFKQIDIKEWVARKGTIKIQTERHPLASSIGILLSSYSQAVNKQNRTTGSLFQQKTKAIHLDHLAIALQVFNYIHQNPLVGGLVRRMEDWPFSSFADYAGFRAGTLCNQQLAFELFSFTKKNFYSQSYRLLERKEFRDIF